MFRPKGRREHRRQLGLLAPAAAIASAQAAADATARREIERVTSTRQRDKNEAAYRTEFESRSCNGCASRPRTRRWRAKSPTGLRIGWRSSAAGEWVVRTKTLSVEDRARGADAHRCRVAALVTKIGHK